MQSRILITGVPGIGKTTLVKGVCMGLAKQNIVIGGFYTEEVRVSRQGVGFDIVTWTGERGILARKPDPLSMDVQSTSPTVGQYFVNVKDLEAVAVQSLFSMKYDVLLIDEIGKMEMFSKSFQNAVRAVFDSDIKVILATIPLASGKALQLVEDLKRREEVVTVTVTRENRNDLLQEVGRMVLAALKNHV